MTARPTASAPVFPYDHPTVATVWSRETAALAHTWTRELVDDQATGRPRATTTHT